MMDGNVGSQTLHRDSDGLITPHKGLKRAVVGIRAERARERLRGEREGEPEYEWLRGFKSATLQRIMCRVQRLFLLR